MTESQQLLADYVKTGSETAFRDLVTRYVDLVKLARALSREVMLGGWLHRHTCYVASNTLRVERRRLARERQAVEMNSLEDHSAANLETVAPILDDAINQLGAEDRTAILLRFFEQHDFKSVGEALGSNEEAARKRVDRALDKLESLLKRRGVAFSAAALASALSAQAVSAAPAGLAITISSVALTSAAAGGGATLTILNIMSMTKLKVGIITVAVAAAITIPVVIQQQTKTRLAEANEALRQKTEQLAELRAENDRLAGLAAQTTVAATTSANPPSRELLKLRSEVGRLSAVEREAAAARSNAPSALSGITADPVMRKTIRDQQKVGLGMIYKEFGKRAGLSTEMGEKLTELLADDVMDNIDRITEVLREGKSPAEMDRVFVAQEAALREKVKELLEPEAYTQYLDYTKNLAALVTAEQFKGMMTGEKEEKDAKAKQLYQLLQVESEQMLASAGLPPDYQTVPSLNFRNFASETEAEKNLKLLGDIYERAAARADSILSPQEIVKFGEFRTMALNNNRMALAVNRKLMAPTAAAK